MDIAAISFVITAYISRLSSWANLLRSIAFSLYNNLTCLLKSTISVPVTFKLSVLSSISFIILWIISYFYDNSLESKSHFYLSFYTPLPWISGVYGIFLVDFLDDGFLASRAGLLLSLASIHASSTWQTLLVNRAFTLQSLSQVTGSLAVFTSLE